jgi:hypothetical protein
MMTKQVTCSNRIRLLHVTCLVIHIQHKTPTNSDILHCKAYTEPRNLTLTGEKKLENTISLPIYIIYHMFFTR